MMRECLIEGGLHDALLLTSDPAHPDHARYVEAFQAELEAREREVEQLKLEKQAMKERIEYESVWRAMHNERRWSEKRLEWHSSWLHLTVCLVYVLCTCVRLFRWHWP